MYRESSGEVLPKFCLESERSMETNLIHTSAGGIRTYTHLVESRSTAYMQFIVFMDMLYMVEDGGPSVDVHRLA